MKHIMIRIIAAVSLLLCLFTAGGYLYHDLSEVHNLKNQVNEIMGAEHYADIDAYFGFDGILVRQRYRIMGDGDEQQSRTDVMQYIPVQTARIFSGLSSSCAVIALLSAVLGSYFIRRLFPEKKIVLPAAGLSIFALLFAAVTAAGRGIPMELMDLSFVLGAVAATLSIAASMMLAEVLYRRFRMKWIVWIGLTALVIAGYFSGTLCKFGLYSEKYKTTFSYVYELDERFGQEEYLDLIVWNEDGTMTFDGTEYAPEVYENPDHDFGVSAAKDAVMEALNPSAGIYCNLVIPSVPETYAGTDLLYCIQALLWIVVCSAVLRKYPVGK